MNDASAMDGYYALPLTQLIRFICVFSKQIPIGIATLLFLFANQ